MPVPKEEAPPHHETAFCLETEALLMSSRSNLSNLSCRAGIARNAQNARDAQELVGVTSHTVTIETKFR